VLNEDQRRLWLGAEARAVGADGAAIVAKAVGVSPTTVKRGLDLIERIDQGDVDAESLKPALRQRRRGGGRKSLVASQPGLLRALLRLVEPEPIRGRPPPLLCTAKSREKLADALKEADFRVGGPALGELLKVQGFRVRGSGKFTGHMVAPAEQFSFVNDRLVKAWESAWPVLGVELFRVDRRSVPRDSEPDFTYSRYRRHDDRFADEAPKHEAPADCEVCGASKFNRGSLIDPDSTTVDLAGQALNNWWDAVGADAFGGAERLTLVVGGISSEETLMRQLSRVLVGIARSNALSIEVLHLPPGTCRWRAVAQRFSLATNCNDIARRLERHEIILEQPIINSLRRARTGRHRQSATGNGQSRELQTGRGMTVQIEALDEYPAWNYFIRVE
jgi:hypothetical protein